MYNHIKNSLLPAIDNVFLLFFVQKNWMSNWVNIFRYSAFQRIANGSEILYLFKWPLRWTFHALGDWFRPYNTLINLKWFIRRVKTLHSNQCLKFAHIPELSIWLINWVVLPTNILHDRSVRQDWWLQYNFPLSPVDYTYSLLLFIAISVAEVPVPKTLETTNYPLLVSS